jgi:nucleoside-diphosphate-sugar epimerase
VATEREIVGMLQAAVPPGQPSLDEEAVRRLRSLTQALITVKADAGEEYERFQSVAQRALCLPEDQLSEWLRGAAVLVTGGTGCIGSTLMAQVAAQSPGRLVSVSRGITAPRVRLPGAEYLHADIRDRQHLDALIRDIRPDVVFHVAAQRDPGLAEREVHRTVTTNVLGTRNVLAAASEAGVPQVVCASTGKALRPYSPDIYAASKRAAEWLASCSSADDMRCSAARFTHVVDNSIIHQRLTEWVTGGGVIRLHSPDIAFYIQSGLESAQLLLIAGLGAVRGQFLVHAITDLGWPVSLLDLAVGVLAKTGSASPIYVSGYDRGYEEIPFPGLYDPATAGEVSPLLNAFEAARVTEATCHMVDAFPLEMKPDPEPVKLLAALEDACAVTEDPDVVRAAFDELSWSLLDVTLRNAPRQTLARSAAQADPHRAGLSPEHQRLLAAIRRDAGLDSS